MLQVSAIFTLLHFRWYPPSNQRHPRQKPWDLCVMLDHFFLFKNWCMRLKLPRMSLAKKMKNVKTSHWMTLLFLIHVLYYMLLTGEKCHPGRKAYPWFVLFFITFSVLNFWQSAFLISIILQDNDLVDLQAEYEDLLIKFETQVRIFYCFCSSIYQQTFLHSILIITSYRELWVRYKLNAWHESLLRLICFLEQCIMTTSHLISIKVPLMGTITLV